MDYINWGLIGFGKVVKNNKNGLPFNTEKSKVYAFTQKNTELGEKNKKDYCIEKYYNNVIDLLSDKKITAIYICTPPGLHSYYAKLCCDYKKPTYIEKPFCRNLSESKKLVEYFSKSNLSLWVAHYKRTLPKFKKIKEFLCNGIIGKIVNVIYNLERPFNSQLLKHEWLYNIELSGGGRFFDIAPHIIDLLIFFFGNFSNVYGIATNNRNEYNVEDVVSFCFKTESNVIGSANFNFISNRRVDSMIIYGENGNISFSVDGGGDIILNINNNFKTFSFEEPKIYELNMVNAINNELLNNEYNNTICHGTDALETYRVIDLILDDFYHGRRR